MIIKRITEGVKRQDWFTVMVEVTIVVVGVYLGIFIGDIAKERELQGNVFKNLNVLHAQLLLDQKKIDEVIAQHQITYKITTDIIDMLMVTQVDEKKLAEAMQDHITMVPFLFHSNTSAYQAMREMGYLAIIKNQDLQIGISGFFEGTYKLYDEVALNLSENYAQFQINIRDVVWDRMGDKFIDDNPKNIVLLRNAYRSLQGDEIYYLETLIEDVRPAMVEVIKNIEANINPDNNKVKP